MWQRARDTSCAFDGRDQGSDQRGIAHDDAERCHADQRCAPREGARGADSRHVSDAPPKNAEETKGARRPQVHEARHPHQEEERRRQTIESSRFVYTAQFSAILSCRHQTWTVKLRRSSPSTSSASSQRREGCRHPPAVVQPQPKQGATVKIEAWRLVCVREYSWTQLLEPRTAREAKV